MRSSCVAFCLFAIYLSSSSYASSIARRDGHMTFPSASMENVQENSNYPTEGAGDPPPQQEVPDVKAPASGSPGEPKITDPQAKTPPPVTGQEDNKGTPSNYPTGSSGPETPVEPASPPPPVVGQQDKKDTPSNYPSGGSGPDQQAPPNALPIPTHQTAKDPTQGQGPPVMPSPALGDSKPNPPAPMSPPAGSDNHQNPSSPPNADKPTSPPAVNSPTSPAVNSPTPAAGNSSSPSTDNSTGPAAPVDGQDTTNKTSPDTSATSSTLQCPDYLDANTDHAACGPEGTPNICTGGCTGAIVAQLCQLNETSPNTTETCTNAYRESSATVHVCINDAGAFSCRGPATGSVSCSGCPSQQGLNNTAGSEGPSPGSGSSNETTPGSPGGDSGNSAGAFISPFNALLTSAVTLVGGALLL